jgi:DNA polymerase III subunit delta'
VMLANLSAGSLGAALRLARGNGLEIAGLADRLLDGAAAPDPTALSDLADKIARFDDGLESFGEFLAQAVAARILARVGQDGHRLDRGVALWERINASFGRSVALHLEPRQTILSAARAAARTGPL